LCGVRPDGITSFSMIQAASDAGNAPGLVFFSVRSSLPRRRRREHLLEPHHDLRVMPSGGPIIPGLGGETRDQRVNEALFYGSRDLGVG